MNIGPAPAEALQECPLPPQPIGHFDVFAGFDGGELKVVSEAFPSFFVAAHSCCSPGTGLLPAQAAGVLTAL